MVQYYYDRYQAVQGSKTAWRIVWGADTSLGTGQQNGYPSYSISDSGNISVSGALATLNTEFGTGSGPLYRQNNASDIVRYVIREGVIISNYGRPELYTTGSGTYSRGSLVQSNIVAENGTYPVNGRHTDGYWYVRGAVANEAPVWSAIPIQQVKKNGSITINLANFASDPDGNALIFSTNGVLDQSNAKFALSGNTLIITGKQIGSASIPIIVSDGTANASTTITVNVVNSEPIVTITSPSNNGTLYENDVFNIAGTASDTDNGNTVTVRYQINATTARAIKAFLSDGSKLESFSKSLTFKGGSLYDGTTLIAENLADGVAHTLKVWATDDQGGSSAIREISFYVVPNRAPLLAVNSPVINGVIDSDKFTVNGTFEDSDGNTTTVSYRINGSTSVQIAEGVSGQFEFEMSFGQLIIGENQIVVEAVDSYGAKVSKTVKLNKSTVETPLLKSTARYKINPPTGTAKAVLLWIQRDTDLDIEVSLSMTMVSEAESFVPLTALNTAPVDQEIVEDEFFHEADVAKDNIIVQIDMTRESTEVNDRIHLISGVLD